MANLIRNFINGILEKDLDERLVPSGKYRHAENVLILNSEGSDVGAVNKSYSNKKLTNYDFGANPKCHLGLADETNDLLYYFIKSDTGCFLVEWDHGNEILSIVLGDTRPEEDRVLNLKDDYLITGIEKIITEDRSKSLLLFTDDNIQPCCVNIERAKSYGINGFTKEDIFLVKKPPRYAPKTVLTYTNDRSNNLEDRFLLFAYRYKYLDGEYSALSSYSNYKFNPKKFELDFFTLVNKGMINKFNAVQIKFDTGEKQVIEIQIVVKESNSNNLYIVETFNKADEGWGDGQEKSFIFSNQKLYSILPEKELYRNFDNVPLKAKSLSLIANIPVFGNYVEGFDIKDANGNKIVIDYDITLQSANVNDTTDLDIAFPEPNELTFESPEGIVYAKDFVLFFYFSVNIGAVNVYINEFSFLLEEDYATIEDLVNSIAFTSFVEVINNHFIANYNSDGQYEIDPDYALENETSIVFTLAGGVPTFTVTPLLFIDTANADAEVPVDLSFNTASYVGLSSIENTSSCKSNTNLQVGLIYMDDFNRATTTLTSKNNTIFIPQKFSIFKNTLRVTLNNPPPAFADRYKLVVKANPLQYQTIFVNEFYNEDSFVWAKLQSDNKDKVNVGDTLIVKVAASNPVNEPIKVKVLNIKAFEKDFIEGNVDDDGNDIIETAGTYMQIRPTGFSMDLNDYRISQNEVTAPGSSGFPVFYLDLFTILDPALEELSVSQGSSIYLYIQSNRKYDDGWTNIIYENTFFTQRDYTTLEEWFEEVFLNGSSIYGIKDTDESLVDYSENLELVRGFFTPPFTWTPDPAGKLYLKVTGLLSGGSNNRKGYGNAKIVVRNSTGVYVFETQPRQADSEIFFETEQTFDIVDGNHQGNVQNQDVATFAPAVIDLDFFNCYAQGNGVESYRIRDEFNTKFLNIDSRPSAVSIEPYKQVRRFADITHGEAFIESSNINGLNEFNLSKGNFKELDKQYGSIQITHSRDGDIVVLQEDKASRILINKDLLFSPDGSAVVTSVSKVLAAQEYYMGDNGIGKNPESLAVNDYQLFYVNSIKGYINRLSNDGITTIMNGMIDYFRDLFISKPFAKKIGGFDPYHKQYFISFGDEPDRVYNANCGNTIVKNNTSTVLTYILNLNNLVGDIVLNYNITDGNATITALYDGDTSVASNVTGLGSITIPRTDVNLTEVLITVTPVGEDAISYEISNICPVGIPLKVVEIVLNDDSDTGKTIDNRYRWGGSNYFSTNDVFEEGPITRYDEFTGIEGIGRHPQNGSVIRMEALKKASDTGRLDLTECNRMGYLVSSEIYDDSDIATILAEATFLTITTQTVGPGSFNEFANFLYERVASDEILYLIWDYTNRKPIANSNYVSTPKGSSINIDVLANDSDPSDLPLTVTIITPPVNGTAVVELDGTITYEHNDNEETTDTIVYEISNGSCSSTATVFIDVAVSCDEAFSYSGNVGVFNLPISFGTDIGECGIAYQAFSIPDKFELFYNGVLVSTTGIPVSGTGTLTFMKTTALPTQATIVVTADNAGTAWSITGICPNVSSAARQGILDDEVASRSITE